MFGFLIYKIVSTLVSTPVNSHTFFV